MRIYAICDDSQTLTGLRLAGIDGCYATEKREILSKMNEVRADAGIAILVVTEGVAATVPDEVRQIKLYAKNPLLVIVPPSSGSSRGSDSITALIREAIGVKI